MRFRLAAAAAWMALPSAPAVADALCDRIEASTVRSLHVPVRITTVVRQGAKPDIVSELVRTADTEYARTGVGSAMGPWKMSPYDAAAVEAKRGAKVIREGESCSADGGDTLEGEAADIVVHLLGGDLQGTKERVWLSRATDLPLKSQAQLPAGFDIDMVYDYKNTMPPSDAPASSAAPASPATPGTEQKN